MFLIFYDMIPKYMNYMKQKKNANFLASPLDVESLNLYTERFQLESLYSSSVTPLANETQFASHLHWTQK